MNSWGRERMSSLFWLLMAIFICFGSVKLSVGDFHKPGPGFFSLWSGVILGTLSFLVFLQSFKGVSKDERKVFWPNPQRGLKMIYTIILLTLYAIGMNYLGFLFSTLLFLGCLLKIIEPQRWLTVFVWSILGTIGSYGIFKYWLEVQFPVGILGF